MLDALHQVVADQVARVGLVLQARRLQRAGGVPWSWWNELSVQEQRDVTRVVEALEELGTALPRQYSPSIRTSRHGQMRELRVGSGVARSGSSMRWTHGAWLFC